MEINNFEKNVYLMENNDRRFQDIPQNQKTKRITMQKAFLVKAKNLQKDIKVSLGMVESAGKQIEVTNGIQNESRDSQKKVYEKDEHGEYENTKGLDNKELLQQ